MFNELREYFSNPLFWNGGSKTFKSTFLHFEIVDELILIYLQSCLITLLQGLPQATKKRVENST